MPLNRTGATQPHFWTNIHLLATHNKRLVCNCVCLVLQDRNPCKKRKLHAEDAAVQTASKLLAQRVRLDIALKLISIGEAMLNTKHGKMDDSITF